MSDAETYDKLAKVLKDVHERFPDDGFTKHQRLRGLLSDHMPDSEREIRIALDAIDEGVVGVLDDTPEAERGLQVDRLVTRLDTSRGIREDIARQIIQAFAFAMDKGGLPSTAVITPAPMPPTPPPATGDDWIGVSEAVDPNPTPPPPGNDDEQGSAGGGLLDKLGGGNSRNLLIGAAVVVAAIVFWPSDKSEPQQQRPEPVKQDPIGPNDPNNPNNPKNVPQIDPEELKDLPRVGPGAQGGGGQPVQPQSNPGWTGQAMWYDDYGLVWSVNYNQTQFQGTTNSPNGPMGIAGGTDPQTGMINYQLFNAAGGVVGVGQGQFNDQTHIYFTTVDGGGNIIGQGQFHINHAPQ